MGELTVTIAHSASGRKFNPNQRGVLTNARLRRPSRVIILTLLAILYHVCADIKCWHCWRQALRRHRWCMDINARIRQSLQNNISGSDQYHNRPIQRFQSVLPSRPDELNSWNGLRCSKTIPFLQNIIDGVLAYRSTVVAGHQKNKCGTSGWHHGKTHLIKRQVHSLVYTLTTSQAVFGKTSLPHHAHLILRLATTLA